MTGVDPDPPTTVRALIERQAAQRPDAVYAVATDCEARLTFTDLARACLAVGALLRKHGLDPASWPGDVRKVLWQ